MHHASHRTCCRPAGEFYEVKCHEGPIARLRVSYDDCLLVSSGEDGSVVLMDIRDKELAKSSSRQQQVRLVSWAMSKLGGYCRIQNSICLMLQRALQTLTTVLGMLAGEAVVV